MRSISRTACFTFILLVVAALQAEGRVLHRSASELVSDGVDDDIQPKSSYLHLKGIHESSSGEDCEQMYGFLPCSKNIWGHLFLILVYEYLLFHGVSFLADGVFRILGPGIFGVNFFDILGALPESLILLVTGLFSDKESAQEYASTGVGLLAGSSILLLTVVWGFCVIVGRQKLKKDPLASDSDASNSSKGKIKVSLTGSGITMDKETRKMARIMLFSIIPLIIMQLPRLFHFSSTPSTVTLIISSVVAVILYIIYQIFKPRIEKKRMECIKFEQSLSRFSKHVEKQILHRFLDEDEIPDVNAITSLYDEISSQKTGNRISTSDIREQLENESTETNIIEEQIADFLGIIDQRGGHITTREEFVNGLTEFINQTRHALDIQYVSEESQNPEYQVFIKPWIEYTRIEHELKGRLIITEVLSYVRHHMVGMVGNIVKDDGTPNESAIRRLFDEIDINKDSHLSKSELSEKLVMNIQFGTVNVDAEEAVTKIIEEFDTNRDNEISVEEFVNGFTKWINADSSQVSHSESLFQGFRQDWKEVKKAVQENQNKGVRAWLKAIAFLVLGITILSILAEPLIASVQKFSEDVGISSFFISFILVPLATNFKEATLLIKEASHKRRKNTSHTFSEIYRAVFMNNILGFIVISILIYVREITWEFSANVLVVAIVCAVMGLTASFCHTLPLWTSFPAFLLYLVSLVLVFVLKDVLNYV